MNAFPSYGDWMPMAFELPAYREPDFSDPLLLQAPDVRWARADAPGVAPRGFHSTSMHPEYLKIDGAWQLVRDMAMDDVIRRRPDGRIDVVPERVLRADDEVALGRAEDGSEGVLVWPHGFDAGEERSADAFAFRSARSRETSYARDYDRLMELLAYEREHGNVLWVMGPAFSFDADARAAMQRLVEGGYVHGVLAGNALATHDLEGALLHTALGQDIYTQQSVELGHYNHLDVINEVRRSGSIPQFIDDHDITDGIMYALVRKGVPFSLAGSIRDDGPLPEVEADVYAAQGQMYELICKATTIVCMATMLHTIATGNLAGSYCVTDDGTVRPKYFYAVDANEFPLNKLHDRGSLAATTIVANACDFIHLIARGLGA